MLCVFRRFLGSIGALHTLREGFFSKVSRTVRLNTALVIRLAYTNIVGSRSL